MNIFHYTASVDPTLEGFSEGYTDFEIDGNGLFLEPKYIVNKQL